MQKIIPAILTKNKEDLREKLELLKGATDWVQIDVMDGKFVENTSIPLSALQKIPSDFSFEIHLMVEHPEHYLKECATANAKRVIFHLEGKTPADEVLEHMEQYSFEKGIALNPETPASDIVPYAKNIDAVLLLSVHPGFQGRQFIPPVLEKIKVVKTFAPSLLVGVDGGVDEPEELKRVFQSGADYVVVGSGIWQTSNPLETLRKMRAMIE